MAEDFVEIADSGTVWRFERNFLTSNWTCLWGRGCLGIETVAAPELQRGCCSVGAEMGDEDEARLISALAATLDRQAFQYADDAKANGIFDGERYNTRVVDGACIFLNRPGFAGGAGCALHIAATQAGEPTQHWKPSVCWQLPLRVEWERVGPDAEVATVRRWTRRDWGEEGETMAWCCTEDSLAYVGSSQVVDSLSEELAGLAGETVIAELRRRLRSQSQRRERPAPGAGTATDVSRET